MISQHFRLTGSVKATECGGADTTTTDVHRVGIERRAAIDTDAGSGEVCRSTETSSRSPSTSTVECPVSASFICVPPITSSMERRATRKPSTSVHIKAVADLLGHSSMAITSIAITGDIYGQTSDDTARGAVDGWSGTLGLLTSCQRP